MEVLFVELGYVTLPRIFLLTLIYRGNNLCYKSRYVLLLMDINGICLQPYKSKK